MAWKLKKWKSAEAEEQEEPEQSFEIVDEASEGSVAHQPAPEPIFAEPEPSQAFEATQFAQDGVVSTPPAAPNAPDSLDNVIALGPAPADEPQNHPSDPVGSHAASAPAPPVHDLDETTEADAAPIDFTPPSAASAAAAPAQDYFAASASSDQSAFDQFQPEEPLDEPAQPASHIEFDLDAAPLEPIEMPPPSFEPPAAAPAPPPAKPAPAQRAESDSLDAFAPYKPSSVPAPLNGRDADTNNSAQQAPAATGSGANPAGVAPTPASADNGHGHFTPSANPPDFEDTLSFAPIASSRVIVKIGPFAATYEISKPEITIGRPDVKTGTSPDIPLEWDDAVSRRHAVILRKSDGDYIEDVGSSNGTLLNGQPIAVDTPILLKDGDVITIGERTQISYLK